MGPFEPCRRVWKKRLVIGLETTAPSEFTLPLDNFAKSTNRETTANTTREAERNSTQRKALIPVVNHHLHLPATEGPPRLQWTQASFLLPRRGMTVTNMAFNHFHG